MKREELEKAYAEAAEEARVAARKNNVIFDLHIFSDVLLLLRNRATIARAKSGITTYNYHP